MKNWLTLRVLVAILTILLAVPVQALACGGGGGGGGSGNGGSAFGSGKSGNSFDINSELSRSVARIESNISRLGQTSLTSFGKISLSSFGMLSSPPLDELSSPPSSQFSSPSSSQFSSSPSDQFPLSSLDQISPPPSGVAEDTIDIYGLERDWEKITPQQRNEMRARVALQHAGLLDTATTAAEWTETGAKIAGWALATYATWGVGTTAAGTLAQSTAWGVGTTLTGSGASALGDYLAGNDPRTIQTIAYDQTKRVLTSALPPGIDLLSDFGMDALTTEIAKTASKNDVISPNIAGGARVRDRLFQEPQDAPRSSTFDMRGEQQTTQEAW